MDIDLLSKMVKELILDNERVVLPGLGSFVAEIVPATFSDKGYTINPPYRKLYFRSKPDVGSDLIAFYAKSNSVSDEIAERVIVDFVSELKVILFHKKTVIFPGLGRLRATKENNVFFVADEELDIYPEGFGLEPISLKSHEASVAEVRTAVSDLKAILSDPTSDEVEPVVEVEVVPEEVNPVVEVDVMPIDDDELPVAELVEEGQEELQEESQGEPQIEVVVESNGETVEEVNAEVQEEVKKLSWKTVLKVLVWMIVALLILTAAYVAVAHLCPEWIDQFLYSPEELEILNYKYE